MTNKYNTAELKEKLKEADCLSYNMLAQDLIEMVLEYHLKGLSNPYIKYDATPGSTVKSLELAYNITAEHIRLWLDSKLARAMK